MELVVSTLLMMWCGVLLANLADHLIWPRATTPPLALLPRAAALLVLFGLIMEILT